MNGFAGGPSTRSPEEIDEFVRRFERELDERSASDEEKVRIMKDVARAYENIDLLREEAWALRRRVSDISREKGL